MIGHSNNAEKIRSSTLCSILPFYNLILMLQPFKVLVGTFQNREKTQSQIGILANFHFLDLYKQITEDKVILFFAV